MMHAEAHSDSLSTTGTRSDGGCHRDRHLRLYGASIPVGGFYVARKGIIGVWTNRKLDINFPMTVAVLGAVIVGVWEEGAFVYLSLSALRFMMGLPSWAFWAALATMFVGLLGVILPLVPGVGLVWLAALAYAIAEGFAAIDPITFAILTVLGAVGVSSDVWMSQIGAKVGGASIWSLLAGMVLGAIGAIIGGIFFGIGAIPGAIIGALAGIILVEWYRHEDWDKAFKVGVAWLSGCLISGGVQFVISVLMILIFVWQVLRG